MTITFLTRRDVLRTLLSTSIGNVLPFSSPDGRDPKFFTVARKRRELDPVRDHILQAIAQGEATGVAVAVAHLGRIVWEEGFGWANRDAGLKATPRTPFSMASITTPWID